MFRFGTAWYLGYSQTQDEQPNPLTCRDIGCYIIIEHESFVIGADQEEHTSTCPCGDSNHMDGQIAGHNDIKIQATVIDKSLPVNNLCSGQTLTNGSCRQFPPEIWHRIVKHLILYPVDDDPQVYRRVFGKHKVGPLAGLAGACKLLRAVAFEHWVHDFKPSHRDDLLHLENIARNININLSNCVKSLVCMDSFQIYKAPGNAFEHFKFLDELVLDSHSDIVFSESSMDSNILVSATRGNEVGMPANHGEQTQSESTPLRMSYRKLGIKFPPTLRTLKVYNSHVPDIYFIHKVARECAQLRSLTLARCTMFTRANCDFWARLPPNESDSYFSNQEVAAYAAAVGKELLKITELQEVKIGIYLTSHRAISTHLKEHVNPAEVKSRLEVWQTPCEKCALEYQNATQISEKEAATALFQVVPKLTRVSWLSFCSEGRTGWRTYNSNIGNDVNNEFH